VHPNDRVTVSYVNGLVKEYTVKGIVYAELVQTDIRSFITEKEFNSINPLMNDKAVTVHVKTEKDTELEPIMGQISDIRPGLKLHTWQDLAGIVRSMTQSFERINIILRVIALIVAAITIFIVTYVDLVNKRRQIGIQRAIGITPFSIVLSYILRAIFYAIVGIVAAALIYSYIIVPVEARYPFHFPFGDVFLPVNYAYLARSALLLCAVAAFSAFIPAWRTTRIKIVDAIWAT